MSSEKLQDLFYMVLMAGNFLNSVSVRDVAQLGVTFMVSEVARISMILSKPLSAVLNRIAWWRTE